MDKEFIEWWNANKIRFHQGQFSVIEIAYSAWNEGQQTKTR